MRDFVKWIHERMLLSLAPNDAGGGGGTTGSGGYSSGGSGGAGGSGAAVSSPGAAVGGSFDVPLYAAAGGPTQPVNAPALEFGKSVPVLVTPDPNNANDFYLSLVGPSDVTTAGGTRRVIKATTNPFTVWVRNLAQIWGAGTAGQRVILTPQPQ